MGADAAAEEQFGPYVVYERLGVGGMATVHRALERGIEGFERVVALKRLLPHLAVDASFIKSFVREAKLAALLNHVNIVQIFELGRVGTEYFISMEHIDGRDIRRILRHARKVSGPPPIHVTVGLLLQLCDALDYAHHKTDDTGAPMGLVHRDVSPSNVLVTSAGQVKVIDFGIAKAQSIQLRTQTGRVKGKLAYMAPEALTGKDLDARSDVFAAGVIAHELLTARPLFAAKNEYQTLMKVQRGEIVPPSTFNQACPPELDAIVLRALARDPDDRFLHANDMRDELYAMRRQYSLQTADRDIAMWLEWAFSLEAPSGSFTASHTLDPSANAADALSASHKKQAKPRRTEEDESIDIAWGGAEDHHNGAPVLLDDVPDVSEKHLSSASALGAEVRLDLDDFADDIPGSQPTHGARPIHRPRTPTPAAAAALLARPVPTRPRPPTPAAPLRSSQMIPLALAREPSGAVRVPPGAPNLGGIVSRPALPKRVRTITIPPLTPPPAPNTRPSLSPPPPPASPASPPGTPASPASPPGTPPPILASASARRLQTPVRGIPVIPPSSTAAATVPLTGPRGVPSASTPPRGAASASTPPRGVPAGSAPPHARSITEPSANPPLPLPLPLPLDDLTPSYLPRNAGQPAGPRVDSHTTDRTPPISLEDMSLAVDTVVDDATLPSDTILSLPAMRSSEPVVRFRAASVPPEAAASTTVAETPPPTAALASASALTRLPSSTSGPHPRLVTPATELFAEPDADLDADSSMALTVDGSQRQAAQPRPPTTAAHVTPGPRAGRRPGAAIALVVGGCLIVAAAGYVITRAPTTADNQQLAPRRTKATGTVRFAILPSDAAISIEGQPVHAGSPWDIELAPGNHQIEIHRGGYKAWLTSTDVAADTLQTLSIALEPLDAAVIADATLIVQPLAGHEVVLDGTALASGAPLRIPLKIGAHALELRKDGVVMWRTTFEARASAVYDLTSTLAQHAGLAAPAPAPAEPSPPLPLASPAEATEPPSAPATEPVAPTEHGDAASSPPSASPPAAN